MDTKYINEILSKDIQSLGCSIWGVELSGKYNNQILRVYIDNNKGVSIEDCERVSKHIIKVLDAHNDFSNKYLLEVSSPGLDRILFDEKHYRKYVEHLVEVSLLRLFDGQRNFVGLLKGVEEGCLVLQIEEQEYLFPIEEIRKVRLVPVFE